MKDRYGGLNGSFAAQLEQFAEQAKEAMDLTFREVVIMVGRRLVTMSPVGNPDLWKVNVEAQGSAAEQIAAYNAKAAAINASITSNQANYTKSGNLKGGLRLRKPLTKREQRENFGFGVRRAGQGYVGGRFRSNWQLTTGAPAAGEIEEIESAEATIGRIIAAAGDLSAGEVAFIVNTLPYAIPLEYGHSSQTPPNGMVRTTVADFQNIVDRVVRARQA
ncbi:hypothetical protein [Pseudomonas sp. 165]|uniref:hypothetical protein n=1 Tax=Pseudomonas sp. 165 TaxID=2746722 RepID=UPI0025781041|nr:hypothetical protein [Pseudomonas sp. 165]